MITKTQLAEIISVEFIFFQHLKITPELINAWYSHFHNCTKDEFAAALHLAVAESKGWPPTPAHVWEMLDTLNTDPDMIETCEQAWHSVITNNDPSEKAMFIFRTIPDHQDKRKWDSKTMNFKKRDFEALWNNEQRIEQIIKKQKIARDDLGYNGAKQIVDNIFKALENK